MSDLRESAEVNELLETLEQNGMTKNDDNKPYSEMTPEEKKIDLYLRQKKTLEGFLERNAISKEQFEKSSEI